MDDLGRKPLRILLADDNEPFRQRIRSLLRENAAVEVVGEVHQGDEAVRLARALKPDIVVMDVVMPRQNGIEATRRITCELPSTQVIALSGHGDGGFRRAMLDAGATTYILKDDVLHALPGALRRIALEVRGSNSRFPRQNGD